MQSHKLLAVFMTVLLAQLFHADAKLVDVQYPVDTSKVVAYDHALDKSVSIFVYGTCEDKNLPNALDCKLVYDNFEDSPANIFKTFTCDVKITASENRQLVSHLKVEKFELQSVFYSWKEKEGNQEYLKYAFIYMPTCEEHHRGEILNNKDAPNFVLYRNAFDVIDYQAGARKEHDQNGRPLATPAAFPTAELQPSYLVPSDYDTPEQGFFAFSNNQAVHISQDGSKVTHIETIPEGKKYWISPEAYYRFGMCYELEDNKVKCFQWDSYFMKRQLDVTVTLDENEQIVAIFNANDGGISVLSGECQDASNVYTCSKLRSSRIHGDGRRDQYSEVAPPSFDCQVRPETVTAQISKLSTTFYIYFAGICDGKILFSRRP